ncbi:MAG: hypothetical protein U5R48_14845 [Gammaproteobacteria bacterium]|nr:hypothetical protein [Gammaproteobacteria bacterium]
MDLEGAIGNADPIGLLTISGANVDADANVDALGFRVDTGSFELNSAAAGDQAVTLDVNGVELVHQRIRTGLGRRCGTTLDFVTDSVGGAVSCSVRPTRPRPSASATA